MTGRGEDILAWTENAITHVEHTAKAATDGPWETTGIGDYGWTVSMPPAGRSIETADDDQGRADAEHIALNDPEAVLRRCAADRKILDLHGGRMHSCPAKDETGYLDEWTQFDHGDICPAVQLLAEGYGWTEER